MVRKVCLKYVVEEAEQQAETLSFLDPSDLMTLDSLTK